MRNRRSKRSTRKSPEPKSPSTEGRIEIKSMSGKIRAYISTGPERLLKVLAVQVDAGPAAQDMFDHENRRRDFFDEVEEARVFAVQGVDLAPKARLRRMDQRAFIDEPVRPVAREQ